jgi:hypothetical protein
MHREPGILLPFVESMANPPLTADKAPKDRPSFYLREHAGAVPHAKA